MSAFNYLTESEDSSTTEKHSNKEKAIVIPAKWRYNTDKLNIYKLFVASSAD